MTLPDERPTIDPATARAIAEATEQLRPLLPHLSHVAALAHDPVLKSQVYEALTQSHRLISSGAIEEIRRLMASGALARGGALTASLTELDRDFEQVRRTIMTLQGLWPSFLRQHDHGPHVMQILSALPALQRTAEAFQDLMRRRQEQLRTVQEALRPPIAVTETSSANAQMEAVVREFRETLTPLADQLNQLVPLLRELTQPRMEATPALASAAAAEDVQFRLVPARPGHSPRVTVTRSHQTHEVSLQQKEYRVLYRLAAQRHRDDKRRHVLPNQHGLVEREQLLKLIASPARSEEQASHYLATIVTRLRDKLAAAVEVVGGTVERDRLIENRIPKSVKKRSLYRLSVLPRNLHLPTARRL